MAKSTALLIKVRGNGASFARSVRAFGASSRGVREILSLPAGRGTGSAFSGTSQAKWFAVDMPNATGNPWDDAHALLQNRSAFSAAGGPDILAVEPDIEQEWVVEPRARSGGPAAKSLTGGFDPQDASGGKATVPNRLAWHLDTDFSQFKAARTRVGNNQNRITIAHLDTGYDPNHSTRPTGLDTARQHNTIPGENANNATDPAQGGIGNNPGHGPGTLSILAGKQVPANAPGWPGFTDFVGAAPGVNVIPVRIANSVVHFFTSTMVAGIAYARSQGVQVLTMSMGGLSSSALVDAINLAYESGIVLVTAAGNNISGLPTPKSIVFPARYRRVLAACGVMGNGAAYANLDLFTMQGNFGPHAKMATALGAYTPNMPWAEIGAPNVIDMDGSGTSSATPQIAAAAALWLAEHWTTVRNYTPWARVEAVRKALFDSAAKSTPRMGASETFEKIGQGVLHADDALNQLPVAESALSRTPAAQDSWSWADLLFNGGVSLAANRGRGRMLALELTQMAQRVASVEAAMPDPEADPKTIPPATIRRYLEAALDEGNPSAPLRAALEERLGRPGAAPEKKAKPSKPRPPLARKQHPVPPPRRRLRIYALDPTVAKSLDSVSVHEATISLPWDDAPTTEPMQPGPVGEYLEVVDVDPATRRIYDPVDLNDRMLLAQDGLPPSEGNPKFHQQMVYAVAMKTIGHFERALGRRALWSPRYETRTMRGQGTQRIGYEVPRLRLYPHALRTDNAYYSPDKLAILFGYFQSSSTQGSVTTPGSMVFTCLSSDIIAHEMSHALLDGLHRRFQENSNPDVAAFHEAFADIVALFQHFTLSELVKFEIAKTRGNIEASNLLSELAAQFGEGTGRPGPLRDYGKPQMADLDYATTMEAHDRGSILVFAVYDAFLAIVGRRTADLTRLATGGSGILPAGALHPGLVAGLADEVVKSAGQVLTMCIRALDYCPAVDITFGEYLRAILTADADVFPEDPLNYRLAFMESFRKWNLLPRDVKTVSTETLTWSGPDAAVMDGKWVKRLIEGIDLGWNQKLSRSEIFKLNEENRWRLWRHLKDAFEGKPEIMAQFGLMPDLPSYRSNGQVRRPAAKGSTTFDVYGVRPARRVEPDGSFRTEIVAVIQQRIPLRLDGKPAIDGTDGTEEFVWFRGGATVIIDPRDGYEEIRFVILKNTSSEARQKRQIDTELGGFGVSPLRAQYFGADTIERFALLHANEGARNG